MGVGTGTTAGLGLVLGVGGGVSAGVVVGVGEGVSTDTGGANGAAQPPSKNTMIASANNDFIGLIRAYSSFRFLLGNLPLEEERGSFLKGKAIVHSL